MTRAAETFEEPPPAEASDEPPRPGLLVVLSCGTPTLRVFDLGLVIGREQFEALGLADHWLSREHAHVTFDGKRWTVADRGSRNGTFVDGARISGTNSFDSPRVIRAGRTLLLPLRDVRRFEN